MLLDEPLMGSHKQTNDQVVNHDLMRFHGSTFYVRIDSEGKQDCVLCTTDEEESNWLSRGYRFLPVSIASNSDRTTANLERESSTLPVFDNSVENTENGSSIDRMINTESMNILSHYLPYEILSQIFSKYLTVDDVCRFDAAISDRGRRALYLECIGSEASIWAGDEEKAFSSEGISWLSTRNIKIRHFRCLEDIVTNEMAIKIATFSSHLHWLKMDFVIYMNHIVEKCPHLRSFIIIDSHYTYSSISYNAKHIIRMAKYCPLIEHLDLSQCSGVTDTVVSKIAECYPKLRILLLLDKIDSISDISICKIARGCPEIRTLHLISCNSLTNDCLFQIAEDCPNLEDLDLFGCSLITDIGIIRIAECCPHLENLNMEDCRNITDTSIIRLSECCPNIKSLDLDGCDDISDASIVKIAECCHNIEILTMRGTRITDMSIIKIAEGCPKLEVLSLRGNMSIHDISIAKIAENCPNLNSLNLKYCGKITDIGIFRIVACCTKIKNLNLFGCNVTRESMFMIFDDDGEGSEVTVSNSGDDDEDESEDDDDLEGFISENDDDDDGDDDFEVDDMNEEQE